MANDEFDNRITDKQALKQFVGEDKVEIESDKRELEPNDDIDPNIPVDESGIELEEDEDDLGDFPDDETDDDEEDGELVNDNA